MKINELGHDTMIGLQNVKPVRWAETLRRIEAIETFLSHGERTNAALAQVAGSIGLSGEQFRRLVRAWELHKDVLLIQPRGAGTQRNRTDGLDPITKEIMATVISDLGPHADLRDITAEICRRCELAGVVAPSDQYAWKAMMLSRRHDRKAVEGARPCTLIGRVWFDIPVRQSEGKPIFRPEVVIALALPSKAILLHRSDIEIGRKPKVEDIIPHVPHDPTVRMTPLEAGRLASRSTRSQFDIDDGAQMDLARYLGCAIGNLPVRYRRPNSEASSLIVSKFDRPLGIHDAKVALDTAFSIHAEEISAGATWPTFAS